MLRLLEAGEHEYPHFLVSMPNKQCVEVAVHSGCVVRSSQEPRTLALFCHAHQGEPVEMLNDGDLDRLGLSYGELTEWKDHTADSLYKAMTGAAAPESE